MNLVESSNMTKQREFKQVVREHMAKTGERYTSARAQLIAQPILKQAAMVYREAGELWAQVASLIAECGDPAVRQACDIADRRLELSDAHGEGLSKEGFELWQKRHKLGAECKLTKEAALSLYSKMAYAVGRISDAERSAVESLNRSSE